MSAEQIILTSDDFRALGGDPTQSAPISSCARPAIFLSP